MRAKAQHYSILVVDIEKFGRRANPVQLWLRERLYALVETAFEEAGIDHRTGPRPTDRGDGFFWLLPGSVDKVDLTGRFVALLHDRLREHARTSSEEAAMRLRVALHDGDVARDGRGWAGEELNSACRLADIQPLRDALGEARRSCLALAVSADWYRRVVRHDYPEVERQSFRRVPFDAKEIQGESAWVRVPGYDFPPGLTRYPDASDPGARPRPPAAAPGAADPAPRSPFAGAHFGDVGQVNAGDQVLYGPQTFHLGGGSRGTGREGNPDAER